MNISKFLGRWVYSSLIILSSNLLLIENSYSQTKRVTIVKDNITLNDLLSEIRKLTGYDFVFTSSKIDFQKRVSPNFQDASVIEILSHYFNPASGVIHVFKNQTIILLDEDKAEYRLLQGKVINSATKNPISGVTVGIREKNIKTKTDSQGNFNLNVPEYTKEIEFNFIGYKRLLVPVTSSVKYQVELEEKSESLSEVVITGIFNRNKESFTGATTSISGEDLKKVTTTNIFTAIAAVDPSFRLVQNNELGGNINQLPDIQIRGQNSFPNLSGELSSNPNLPLFILDGFEASLQRITDLDMNMIAGITILKDASATAIYGARGANGVMVITTIAPKPGKVQVTLTNDLRLSIPDLSVYDYLNAKEKLDFEKRAGVYSSDFSQTVYRLEYMYNERAKNVARGIDTDWKKIPTQIGYNNRTNLNFQGGDQHIRYGVLVTADLQQGVMKGQDRKNYSGQFDLQYVVDKLRVMNSVRIIQNKSNESPYGSFSDYVSMNPYYSPYNENGNLQQYLENSTVLGKKYQVANPVYDLNYQSVDQSGYLGISNNFQIRYNFLPNLFLESSLSITRQKGNTDQFYSAQDSRFNDITDINRKGSYTQKNTDLNAFESLTTLNYNLSKDKHQFYSTAAFNFASSTDAYTTIVAEGFPFDRLDNLLFAAQYQDGGRPTGDEGTVRRVGLLYNGSYSYDNRFLLDLSIKRDGSSQYGNDKRFGTFWSSGIGWNLHHENFIKRLGFINRLKLRSSYGVTGSLNIPAYSAQTRYNFSSGSSYYTELGAMLVNLGNPFLSWQNVHKLNIGTDIELWNKKVDLRFDYYRDLTKNTLTQISLAPSTGFASFNENLGKVQNVGFEFSARLKAYEDKTNGTLWTIFFNGITNKNKLKEISNRLKASNDQLNDNTETTVPNILFEEGKSMTTIWVVQSLGVDPTTGSELFLTKKGEKTYDWNVQDKIAFGDTQPKWNGNFGSNLLYKGFELGFIFNYQFGGQLYNQTLVDRVQDADPNNNVDRRAYELGWNTPGDVTQFTKISVSSAATRPTSRFVQDNNFLNLTTLSFGYNFYKADWLKRAKLRSLQVTAIANDLTRFSSIAIERGTSNPFAKNFSISLRVGF